MTGYTRHLNENKSIGAGVSVFKEDTNLYVKCRQNNVTFSAYGAVRKPFVGVSGMITF